MCISVCMYTCAPYMSGVHGGQRRPDSPELVLQTAVSSLVWVLENASRPDKIAANVLKY